MKEFSNTINKPPIYFNILVYSLSSSSSIHRMSTMLTDPRTVTFKVDELKNLCNILREAKDSLKNAHSDIDNIDVPEDEFPRIGMYIDSARDNCTDVQNYIDQIIETITKKLQHSMEEGEKNGKSDQ
jgi:cell fate (sporulation/competence/biofilm development) regulator YmcA (YheA/YmcA/DUF963 family)